MMNNMAPNFLKLKCLFLKRKHGYYLQSSVNDQKFLLKFFLKMKTLLSWQIQKTDSQGGSTFDSIFLCSRK